MNDAPDRRRLGAAVKARRNQLLMTHAAIHAAGGPSPTVLQNIENGRNITIRHATGVRLEDALKWRRGSVDALLAGGDALELEPDMHMEVIEESPAERILVEIVDGVSTLPERDRREVLALVRAKQASRS